MTVLAVSTGVAVLAWIGLAVGLVVALVAAALLQAVLRPVREIDRYADHILEAGVGIARNLDAVDDLARTRELAIAAPGLATAYLRKLQGSGSA
jgi:hypothetical protein